MRSKTTVFGVLAGLGLALAIASPAAAADLDRSPVDEILKSPVTATVEAFDVDPAGEERVWDAMEQSAYRWSLTFLSEDVATERAQTIWGEVRNEPDPYEVYGQRLHEWGERERDGLADVLADLQEKEADGPNRAEFERLLFAAHYAAYAESTLMAARSTLETAAENPEHYYESSLGRRTVAYPLAQTSVFLHAADRLLEEFTPVPESPPMDIHSLQHFLEDYGPDQRGWILDAHGTAHTVARQLVIFERQATANLDPDSDIDASLDRLVDEIEPLQSNGFTGTRIMAVAFDVSWWTPDADSDGENAPTHQEMKRRLAAAVETARHEVDVLMVSVPLSEQEGEPQSGDTTVWLPLGPVATPMIAGIAVLALAGVVAATRATAKRRKPAAARRIQSRRGRRKGHGGNLLALILVGLLATSGLTFGDDADAALSPVDPVSEPVVVTPNERHSFYSAVLADSDDQIHIAWGECLDPPDGGCADGRMVMMYRAYDPDTDSWGDANRIVEPPAGEDAYLPVLKETAEGIALIWLQGVAVDSRSSPPTEHPAEVWMCIVQNGACEDSQRLSAVDAGVESAAAAVGPDGLLRVSWAEAREQEGHVVFRQQATDGWGDPVEFDDEGPDQRQPAVAVTQDGTAHVVWLAYPIPEEPVYRTVYHASVDGATNEPSSSDHPSAPHVLTTQGAALEAEGDVLHLVYGTERGLYHRTLTDGKWTDAHSVSQSDKNTQRPDIAVSEQGIVVVWMETGHPDPPFRLRMAEHIDGLWLKPEAVIDPPHRALSIPKVTADTVDRFHLVWPGRTTDEGTVRPYYTTLASKHDEAVHPPEIGAVAPEDDSWNRPDPVEMEARLNLSAPLERDDTQWLVNGKPVDYEASGGALSTSLSGLLEGTHEVELTVTDRNGNTDQKQWTFHVDRTHPQFTMRIVDENGDEAEGWLPGPVRVEGETLSDEGAPAHVQAQATDPEDGSVVRLDEDGGRWTTLSGENGLVLPEGFLLDVTVRARDEAGNIKFGDTVQVGWDSSTPELAFDVPEWTTSTDVEIPVDANRSSGAPIDVYAELTLQNSTSDATNTTVRFAPGALRPVTFEGVKDGRYELTVTLIRNAVGTAQEMIPGPWSLGVDTEPPEVALEESDGGFIVEARDETSGIAFLRATQHGNILEEADTEEGAPTVSIRIPTASFTERVVLQVGDVAGNQKRFALNPDGTLEVEEDPDSADGSHHTDGDGLGTGGLDLSQGADDDDRQGNSIPGPSLPVIVVLVTLIAWRTGTKRRTSVRD